MRGSDGLQEALFTVAKLEDFVPADHPLPACRQRHITPHVAANDTRIGGSAIDGLTLRHTGYAGSRTIRKRIEEYFGRGTTIGRIRQTVYRGL